MIHARNLNIRIAGRALLENVDFQTRAGEMLVILGCNGAGKSTLLRTVAGVHRDYDGSVTIGQREIGTMPAADRARAIAHLAGDDLFLDRLTVRDVVSMGRYPHHRWWEWREVPHDRNAIEDSLRSVHMESFANRLFDTLSSGERQRIWLALALTQEAAVLLLDEPTSHLDVRVARDILSLLRAQARAGKTVICVLHDVNEAAEFADRILLLGSNRVLGVDTPERVLDSNLLEKAYGIRMELVRTSSGALRVFPTDS
jgi:iron complex transport system ATP-binding protein